MKKQVGWNRCCDCTPPKAKYTEVECEGGGMAAKDVVCAKCGKPYELVRPADISIQPTA